MMAAKMVPPKDEILEEIQCPNCKVMLKAPIYQCLAGHSICKKCKGKVDKCPLCSKKLSDVRNFALERLIDKMFHKCMFKECDEMGTSEHMKAHLTKCKYYNVKCNFKSCNWFGVYTEVATHLRKKHKAHIVKNGTALKKHQIKLCVIECRKHYFWVKRFLVNGTMYWTAEHLFRTEEDEKFYYKVTINNKEGEKYSSRQKCQNHTINNVDLKDKHKYVCFTHCNFRHENVQVVVKIDPNTKKKNVKQ